MKLIKIFRATGLDDRSLARELGVGLVSVWRWRTGKVLVPPDRINDLCRILGCAPRDLRPDLAKIFEG